MDPTITFIITFILDQASYITNQAYWCLYNTLDKAQINPYFVVGFIAFNEITGITCITIDYILEDIIKPKKRIKVIKYEDF